MVPRLVPRTTGKTKCQGKFPPGKIKVWSGVRELGLSSQVDLKARLLRGLQVMCMMGFGGGSA